LLDRGGGQPYLRGINTEGGRGEKKKRPRSLFAIKRRGVNGGLTWVPAVTQDKRKSKRKLEEGPSPLVRDSGQKVLLGEGKAASSAATFKGGGGEKEARVECAEKTRFRRRLDWVRKAMRMEGEGDA